MATKAEAKKWKKNGIIIHPKQKIDIKRGCWSRAKKFITLHQRQFHTVSHIISKNVCADCVRLITHTLFDGFIYGLSLSLLQLKALICSAFVFCIYYSDVIPQINFDGHVN